MDQITGDHSRAAIFAAEGKARHRLVRIALAAVVALLASWLIALAFGVLGGFDSLPGLPDSQSRGSNAADTQAQSPRPDPSRTAQPLTQTRKASPSSRKPTTVPVSDGPSQTRPPGSAPETKPNSEIPVSEIRTTPSTPSTTTPSTPPTARPGSHGGGQGNGGQGNDLVTTGKPDGSPGNGPGGSGAPGQQP
jgi:hypothetical protein